MSRRLAVDPPPATWVLVAFTGRADLPWLRLLKPGFRHCFAVVHDGQRWILSDSMAHVTAVRGLDVAWRGDLFPALIAEGYVVVPVRARPVPRRAAPLAPYTCVEAVKRLLGVRRRGVLTPWQLFRHLTNAKNP